MTNEEMIKVLQQSMQESMQELKQDIRQEMQQSLEAEREHTGRMMDEKLEPMNQRLDGMQKGINDMKKEIGERMTRLEVSYENETNRIVNLLKEDYSRVSAATAKTHDYNEVKSMVKDHDNALINHNERIAGLEKKAI